MKPRIRGIHVPRPCSEEWSSMERVGDQERYCARCIRCVTDFTGKTDREVIDQLMAGPVCGRFTRSQLDRINRSLRPEPQPAMWRSALLALAGIAGTVPPTMAAPVRPPVVATAGQEAGPEEEKVPPQPSPAYKAAAGTSTLIVEGRVLREPDGKPLGGATVMNLVTGLSVVTDSEGRFRFDQNLPPPFSGRIALRITYRGHDFDPLLLTIPAAHQSSFSVRLTPFEPIAEEIVVGGAEPLFVSVYERLWRPLRLLEDRWRRPDHHRDTPGPLSPRPDR